MMHKSPLLFRLTADCTLEIPPPRTISLTQCCFRDDPSRDVSKDFCRFHHLEPAEVNIVSETPIWYPKPIILTRTNLTNQQTCNANPFKNVQLRHGEVPVTPLFFKHLLANFKDYVSKIQEHFMSASMEESRSAYRSERSGLSRGVTPEPSHSGSRQTTATGSTPRGSSSIRCSGWPQNIAYGMSSISPTKIIAFVTSVWHGFEVMGLTEDNTVG